MATDDDIEERYLDQDTDALGGKHGDDNAQGTLRDDESKQYEKTAKNRSVAIDNLEEDPLNPVDKGTKSGRATSLDLEQVLRMLRYCPFMRLFNACATSMYLDHPRGERMRLFSQRHPRFRKACLIGDFVFTTLISALILAAIAYALAKITGFPIPWTGE
ncbi:hypothetical protein [Bifidobacterium biavatii]|uniref:Uncharacterized protein n=1 Tax=Bifidobacterium biavatii DSM 23969 TaxID=1437608 RepID=A0A086ZQY4_9BIFI|nr:hypothetical protein [Bifidobacterium biavatii]KFI48934.1 hypothetical protein BBIA_1933 [Bifidobacterium biavatii DSM 23969]